MKKIELYKLIYYTRKHNFEVTFDVKDGLGTITAKWRRSHYEVDFPNIKDEFCFCNNPLGDGAVYIYSNDDYVICVDTVEHIDGGCGVLWVGSKHTGCVYDVVKRKDLCLGDELRNY